MPMELQEALPSTFPIIDIPAEKLSSHRNPPDHRRALQVSSGNIQSSMLESLRSDSAKKENGSEVDQARPRRKNARAAATARLEHRKRRRAVTGKSEGSNRKFDILRYRQYRNRVARNNEDGNETVWPNEPEEAFIEGHEIIGPIGREKKLVDGKLRGRFQLIGEYIERKTGISYDRKQISSHNQVLKGYLGTSRSFRTLLPPRGPMDDPNENDLDSPNSLELFLAGLLPRNPHPSYLKKKERERAEQEDPDRLTGYTQRVFPLDFALSAQTPTGSKDGVHIYTNLTSSPMLEPMPLEALPQWRNNFPKLASLQHSGAVDCEITLMEATLNMNAPSTPLTGSVLVTQYELLAIPAYAGHTWGCVTNIYCSGSPVCSFQCPVRHDDTGRDGHVRLRPPFASNFWARKFVQLGEERLNGNRAAADERARIHIQHMSAVQELYATELLHPGHSTSEARSKLVAIYLWRFSTTKPGETEGKTTWRKIYPPPSRILTNSPAPAPPNTASLQETLDLWDEQYGSVDPSADPCILNFGQEQKVELVMPPDSAISMYYPTTLDPEPSQENNNMALTFPLMPPETFDETASLSAFLDSYAETTTAATYGPMTPPPQDGPYHATSYWPRSVQPQNNILAQGFAGPATSFTDQMQDMTETVNEDFGLVFE